MARISQVNLETLGDVGEYSMGRLGRWIFTATQLITCLLVPTAFLILGSIFLNGIFNNALTNFQWILIMAACLLPGMYMFLLYYIDAG
jgi:vesicular inhibitory amino acid transporter